jgi:hypothetical protein
MTNETKRVMGTHKLQRADRRTSQNGKEMERVRDTHFLKSADRWISQNGKRNGASNRYLLPRAHRRRDTYVRKKQSKQ